MRRITPSSLAYTTNVVNSDPELEALMQLNAQSSNVSPIFEAISNDPTHAKELASAYIAQNSRKRNPATRQAVTSLKNYVNNGNANPAAAAAGAPPGSPPTPPTPPSNTPGGGIVGSASASAKKFLDGTGYSLRGNENMGAGLTIGGHNLAKASNVANAAYQGYQGFKNLEDIDNARQNYSDLKSQILATGASNPMASSYLSADNMRLLRQLRSGNYDNSGDISLSGVLGGALKGGAMGFAGGLPGIIGGAIAGGVNGGMSSYANSKENNNARLESLLAELEDAQAQYNQMKRPNYNNLGLQQRYTNQWM